MQLFLQKLILLLQMIAQCGKFSIDCDLNLYKRQKFICAGAIAVNKKGWFINTKGCLSDAQKRPRLIEKRFKKLEGKYFLSETGELIDEYERVLFEGIKDIMNDFVINKNGNLARIVEENGFMELKLVLFRKKSFAVSELIECDKFYVNYMLARVKEICYYLELGYCEINGVSVRQEWNRNASGFEKKLYTKFPGSTISFFSQQPVFMRKSAYVYAVAGLLSVKPKIPKPIIMIILSQCY